MRAPSRTVLKAPCSAALLFAVRHRGPFRHYAVGHDMHQEAWYTNSLQACSGVALPWRRRALAGMEPSSTPMRDLFSMSPRLLRA